MSALQAWIGREETRRDVVTAAPVSGLSATLDRDVRMPQIGDALPPAWDWLYFLSAPRASDIDRDGHGKRGKFLPPVPLPRRMWAGSRITYETPLHVGDEITRVSTIKEISLKEGRSGRLVLVTVAHQIRAGDRLAVREEQDLIYRDTPAPEAALPPARPAPAEAQWSREIAPDPVLLFRYSALTFNGHRIHYDRDYATNGEGYPGLVVHAPLVATLLLDLLWRHLPGDAVRQFEFRALRPLFDTSVFRVQGRRDGNSISLWALDSSQALAMTSEVSLAGRV